MRASLTVLALAAGLLGGGLPGPTARTIANDNRRPAGVLSGGTLTLHLVARLGEWHPDGEQAPGAVLPAFAEEGRAPSIPGPLIRVPAGTTVAVTLRNALPRDTLLVRGLHDRTGAPVPAAAQTGVTLAPGERKTVSFRLAAPGTYYYYGSTRGQDVTWRTGEDSQLTGAIVVDPAGAPPPRDRIFVIGVWTDTVGRVWAQEHPRRLLATINGRSWPHTERLAYEVGDTVHWRIINASGDNHPMHLHGFYFRVDARGDGTTAQPLTGDAADREVTESMVPGTTFDLTWVPERPGRWLFHCHIPEHVARRGPLGLPPAPMAHAAAHSAMNGMNGLVLGIDVRARPGLKAAPPPDERNARHLRLVIRRNGGGSDDRPYYGFAWNAPDAAPPDSGLHIGPPLVLTRGQPVRVTVVNALAEPTSVHWHGIELESYYDGVGGFSGSAGHIAPTIAPRDSFEARFTPPRAGTFIYHTHVEEERQEPAGLAGPIIVLEPGQQWDPATDHPVMITSPWDFNEGRTTVLLNGSKAPPPLELRAGVRHRLRFVNMTTRRPGVLMELRRDTTLLAWRELANDGADLPDSRQVPRPARRQISIGQTIDVEIAPDEPGDMRLEMRIGGRESTHPLLAVLPLRVVPAGSK